MHKLFTALALGLLLLLAGCSRFDVSENLGTHERDGGDAAVIRLASSIGQNPTAKTFAVHWDEPDGDSTNLLYDKTKGTLILQSRGLDLETFSGVTDSHIQRLAQDGNSIGYLTSMGCQMTTYKETHPEEFQNK